MELLDRVLRALSWETVDSGGSDNFNTTRREAGEGNSVPTAISVFHVPNDVTDWKR